ncbi:MAG: DUF1641 domain-containing protein [Alphaproteobacteria bacterium]|nr:DUF1641 domain-containing protein [Alphaproteobacteria bacterium]
MAATAPTQDTLERIERRLERLEHAVGRLTGLLETAGDGLAMAGDIVDDTVARWQRRGGDVDAQVGAALTLVDRLTEPDTAAALSRLLDRVEAVEAGLSGLPGTAAMVADIADTEVARWQARGIEIDGAVERLVGMAVQLSSPDMARLVDTLAQRARTIEGGLELAGRSSEFTAMALDILDDVMKAAGDDGVDLALLAPRLRDGAVASVAFLTSDGFSAFMETMAEPEAFGHLVPLIRAIRDATKEPPEPVSVWGLLSRLRDPAAQQAMGLFLRFAHAIGTTHEQQHGASGRSLEKR